MSQLRQRSQELGSLGVLPVLVSFASLERTRNYVSERKLEWPALVDERRALYAAYGMDRAPFWQIWGPATWRAYAREFFRGERPQRQLEDPRQRGGDVLIDPSGTVRLHHIGRGPADRPSIETILALARRPPYAENTYPKPSDLPGKHLG